jgi:hypothetical protein
LPLVYSMSVNINSLPAGNTLLNSATEMLFIFS